MDCEIDSDGSRGELVIRVEKVDKTYTALSGVDGPWRRLEATTVTRRPECWGMITATMAVTGFPCAYSTHDVAEESVRGDIEKKQQEIVGNTRRRGAVTNG